MDTRTAVTSRQAQFDYDIVRHEMHAAQARLDRLERYCGALAAKLDEVEDLVKRPAGRRASTESF